MITCVPFETDKHFVSKWIFNSLITFELTLWFDCGIYYNWTLLLCHQRQSLGSWSFELRHWPKPAYEKNCRTCIQNQHIHTNIHTNLSDDIQEIYNLGSPSANFGVNSHTKIFFLLISKYNLSKSFIQRKMNSQKWLKTIILHFPKNHSMILLHLSLICQNLNNFRIFKELDIVLFNTSFFFKFGNVNFPNIYIASPPPSLPLPSLIVFPK